MTSFDTSDALLSRELVPSLSHSCKMTHLYLADAFMVGHIHKRYFSSKKRTMGSCCWSHLHHAASTLREWTTVTQGIQQPLGTAAVQIQTQARFQSVGPQIR